ncbi:tyrosine-type recombinase/integrase [Cryobacterium suzukii]|uniref:tyrosine-type recombinase/integrase n=1 Tax=Cryobacterium suzukii TaxID=1259198 RepID=UPI0021032599|nr:site-specific integrase [Cryobacterium suzukii]
MPGNRAARKEQGYGGRDRERAKHLRRFKSRHREYRLTRRRWRDVKGTRVRCGCHPPPGPGDLSEERTPATRRANSYLSHRQVAALATASGDRATLVLIMAYCGLRWGEAIGLQVKDIDFVKRRINVNRNAVEVGSQIEVGTPKSYKVRSVPFPAFLLPGLSDECRDKPATALVFADRFGNHLKRTRVSLGTRSWFLTALTTQAYHG